MKAIKRVKDTEEREEIRLPAIAAALLLDEWRRATMEGQGGWFVRLPRERYDGQGSLWSVVRRTTDAGERIVVSCERGQYQSMADANERRKIEAQIGRVGRVSASLSEELERFKKAKDLLKAAALSEKLEAYEREASDLRGRLQDLSFESGERAVQEWEFGLDLAGAPIVIGP